MTEKVSAQSNRIITVPLTANIAIRSSIDTRKILKKKLSFDIHQRRNSFERVIHGEKKKQRDVFYR